MNHYELLYIVAGKYAETEVKGVSDQIDALVLKVGGTITFTQYWERRKLAYPIDHIQFGHYVITEFDAMPSKLAEFERQMRLSITEVLRHQIVRKDEVGSPLELTQLSADESQVEQTPEAGEVPAELISEPEASPVITEEKPKRAPVAAKTVTPKPPKATPSEEKKEPAPSDEDAPITVIAKTATTPEVAPAVEKETTEDKPAMKKKKEKVSFEDLDKKLDEILNELP